MINGDTTKPAPGVTRHECGWGYYLQGSMPALLASELAKPHWFSCGIVRDKGGRCIRSKRLTEGGRSIHTTAPKAGACTVWIHYTVAEKQAAEEARAAAERRRLSQPEALRAHAEKKHMMHGICFVLAAFNATNSPSSEWTFPPDVQNSAMQLCRELMQLFQNSKIINRSGTNTEGDAEFQRFMQSALIGGGDLDGNRAQH